ncbi:FAD-dependent oxidoreductase [Microbispora triticiradicis]|uniref:FAD-dependent oxidoreductase n=1 Tax=Microbispora triticiradicis TaxID=2200763 RepID=UPI001AD653DD|nr:FAD-dependent oxidoreductase [Microbispora triticiradicis]
MDADVVVIGGGQSGPATAYALRRQGLTPVVLEAADRPCVTHRGGCAGGLSRVGSMYVNIDACRIRGRCRCWSPRPWRHAARR